MSTYPAYASIFAETCGEVSLKTTGLTHRVVPITAELQQLLAVEAVPRAGETPEAAGSRHLIEVAARCLEPVVEPDSLHRDAFTKVLYIIAAATHGAKAAQRLLEGDTAAGNGMVPAALATPTA